MNQKSFNIFPPYCNNISRYNIHIFHTIYIIILLSSFVFKSSESKYILVWSDDFNGQELDRDKWSPLIDCSGRGNNEMQCYTDRTKNVQVYNGSLILTALPESYKNREYTSGRVHAKGPGWMYGFFEARARLPKGKHLWPAIWMVPTIGTYGPWPKSGEIDIMEQRGQVSNSIEGTIHYGYSREIRGKLGSGQLVFPFDFSSDFHTFGFEWTNQSMVWFLDGKKFYSISTNRMFLPPATSSFNPNPITPNPISSNVGSHSFGSPKNIGHNSEISKDEKEKKEQDKDSYKYGLYTKKGQPFDQPFKWILNVAVGGGYFPRSLYGDISVSEAKKWEKPFMEVDWIKVYQNVPEKIKKKKLTTRKPLNQPLIEKVTTEKMTTAKDRMTTAKEKLTTEKLITEKLINDKLIAVTNETLGNESNDIETMTTRKVIPSGDGTSPMMTITTTTQEPSSQVSTKLDTITSNIPPTESHKNLMSHNSTDQNMTSHNFTSHKLSTQVMTTTIKPPEIESFSTSKSAKIQLITNEEKLIDKKLITEKLITTTPNPITSSGMTTEETTVSLQPVYIPEKHSTIFSSLPSSTSLTPSLIDKLINQSTISESSLSSPMTTESTTIESPERKVSSTETFTTKLPTTESLTMQEIPTTKTSTTEIPITEIPITEISTTKISITEIPKTEIPKTKIPTTEVPTTKISNVENLETFNSTDPNVSIATSKFSPTTIAMNETYPKATTIPMPSVTMNRTPTISVNYTISSITSVTKPIEIILVSKNDTNIDANIDTNTDTESSSDPGSESEEYLDNEHESSMNPPNDSGSDKKNHDSDSDKKSNDSDSEKKKSLTSNLNDDKVIIVRVDGDKVTVNGHGIIGEGDNLSDEIDLDGQITSDSEGSFVVTTSTHDPVSDQSDDTPIEYVYYYYEDEIGKKSSSSAHVKDYADYL